MQKIEICLKTQKFAICNNSFQIIMLYLVDYSRRSIHFCKVSATPMPTTSQSDRHRAIIEPLLKQKCQLCDLICYKMEKEEVILLILEAATISVLY